MHTASITYRGARFAREPCTAGSLCSFFANKVEVSQNGALPDHAAAAAPLLAPGRSGAHVAGGGFKLREAQLAVAIGIDRAEEGGGWRADRGER